MSSLINVSESDFSSVVLESKVPAVCVFTAPSWCPPCKLLHPILEDLASESKDQYLVAVLDIDDSPDLAKQYGVKAVPTTIAFKDGKETTRLNGLQSKTNLLKLLSQ